MTYSFSVQRSECVLYTEEGVSLCYMLRRQTPSLYRRERCVFSTQRTECPYVIHRVDNVSLLQREERDRRERVSSLHTGQSVPLLYIEETVSLFYKGRRETPSRCKGECVSLPDREDDIVFLSA